jgi:hypothetical protein
MASYLKASIKRSYAENFLAELERNSNQYFFFVAKTTEWTDPNSPDPYVDSVKSEYTVLNNIIAYKKLNPQNILFALPRHTWTSGTVYSQYDDTIDLFSESNPVLFYVVTEDNNIYKCLSNNGGIKSTDKPNQTIVSPFKTGEGYVWKYLGTIKETDLPYDLTDYIPVDFVTTSTDTETVNQYTTQLEAVNGSITRIDTTLTNGQYPYTITNSGSGPTIRVAEFNSDVGGGIRSITVTDPNAFGGAGKIQSTSISQYIGYVVRVDNSNQDPAEIGNYAIITNAIYETAFGQPRATFYLTDDVQGFRVTPGQGDQSFASVEIIPYIKIYGDGSGAYAFPIMGGSTGDSIIGVDLFDGGHNYSRADAAVGTPVKVGTTAPTLTTVLSPKGGHGSNILRELNAKDILLIINLSEYDSEKFITGGSYRQFGIIKNPVLSDGSGSIAGKNTPYYRDIIMSYEGSSPSLIQGTIFKTSGTNLIVGTETITTCKVVSSNKPSTLEDQTRVTVKVLNNSGGFVTYLDRPNDYVLSFESAPRFPYHIGETVKQTILAGTTLPSGVSFSYDIISTGQVLSSSGYTMEVRYLDGGFVTGTSNYLTGVESGATADIIAIKPKYGEYVWVLNEVDGAVTMYTEGTNNKMFKVLEVSEPYFDESNSPSYCGLHKLMLTTSVSGITGAVDVTASPLTRTSFSNGDFIQQGVSGSYSSDYASGIVYQWDYVNASYGNLWLTDVLGVFKTVQDNRRGSTGATLGTNFAVGATVGAYIAYDSVKPEIDRNSGEVLYIDNIRAINRIPGQKEEFRLRLGF